MTPDFILAAYLAFVAGVVVGAAVVRPSEIPREREVSEAEHRAAIEQLGREFEASFAASASFTGEP